VIDILDGKKLTIHKEKAPSGLVLVDGFSIGDSQEVVIRDRKSLAQEGMFVIIVMVNMKTGKLKKSPDIISRGFVYLRESQELLGQTRLLVKKELAEKVGSFLLQKTNKTPIIIPVILGV